MSQIIIKWRGVNGSADGRSDILLPECAEIEDVLLGMEDALRAMGFHVPLMSLHIDPASDGEDE